MLTNSRKTKIVLHQARFIQFDCKLRLGRMSQKNNEINYKKNTPVYWEFIFISIELWYKFFFLLKKLRIILKIDLWVLKKKRFIFGFCQCSVYCLINQVKFSFFFSFNTHFWIIQIKSFNSRIIQGKWKIEQEKNSMWNKQLCWLVLWY